MTDLSESVNPLSSIAGTFLWGLTLKNSSSVLFSAEEKMFANSIFLVGVYQPLAIFIIRGSNLTLFACSRRSTALEGCDKESKKTFSPAIV